MKHIVEEHKHILSWKVLHECTVMSRPVELAVALFREGNTQGITVAHLWILTVQTQRSESGTLTAFTPLPYSIFQGMMPKMSDGWGNFSNHTDVCSNMSLRRC